MSAVLEVEGLSVRIALPSGRAVQAVDRVSLAVEEGEIVAVVGESGCGKTMLAMSILGLLPEGGEITEGRVLLAGEDLRNASAERIQRIRGDRIGTVFQEPMAALNPVLTVGRQVGEVLRRHTGSSGSAERRRVIELLATVGIPDPDRRFDQYPHEMSGGMAQRVVIAMAIACGPSLLLADEPTTALDVTIQASILRTLDKLRRDLDMAVILITHDLGVVADVADRVLVMYAGRVVEEGAVQAIFSDPKHHYTRGLLAAVRDPSTIRPRTVLSENPRRRAHDVGTRERVLLRAALRSRRRHLPVTAAGARPARAGPCSGLLPPGDGSGRDMIEAPGPADAPVLDVAGLEMRFAVRGGASGSGGVVRAVDGVSLSLRAGETGALVGESGSGKTTVGRCILRLLVPSGGRITFLGRDITHLDRRALRPIRRHMHVVFQDPYTSLNPRMRIGKIVIGPLVHHGLVRRRDRREAAAGLLEQVGLGSRYIDRYPHSLSGGQRQRVAIARALSARPDLLVADEPISALDASVQAAMLNLLMELQAELRFACLFITHDLSAARLLADWIAVMYLGQVVEQGPSDGIFGSPRHPYTQALLSAVPVPDPARQRLRSPIILSGDPPSPSTLRAVADSTPAAPSPSSGAGRTSPP